jgi:hypothetical protein
MQNLVAQCAISVMLVAGSAKGYDSVAVSDQTPTEAVHVLLDVC